MSSLVALCLSNLTSAIYEVTEDVNHSKCIEIFFMEPQIFLCEKKGAISFPGKLVSCAVFGYKN